MEVYYINGWLTLKPETDKDREVLSEMITQDVSLENGVRLYGGLFVRKRGRKIHSVQIRRIMLDQDLRLEVIRDRI